MKTMANVWHWSLVGSVTFCRPMAERSKCRNAAFEKNAKNVFALAELSSFIQCTVKLDMEVNVILHYKYSVYDYFQNILFKPLILADASICLCKACNRLP